MNASDKALTCFLDIMIITVNRDVFGNKKWKMKDKLMSAENCSPFPLIAEQKWFKSTKVTKKKRNQGWLKITLHKNKLKFPLTASTHRERRKLRKTKKDPANKTTRKYRVKRHGIHNIYKEKSLLTQKGWLRIHQWTVVALCFLIYRTRD